MRAAGPPPGVEVGGAARLIPDGPGRLRVEGPLDFSTVSALLAAGAARFKGGGRLEIDLGGVTFANSAGLALLLEWLDLARGRGLSLGYCNLPESLGRIAELSNVGSLLSAAPGAPDPTNTPPA